MPGCDAADVSPFAKYTVTFKNWRIIQNRLRSSNAAVSYGSPNSAEDQAVRMVALASKTDDVIPPTEVLPGRIGGVSFMRRSSQSLLPSIL